MNEIEQIISPYVQTIINWFLGGTLTLTTILSTVRAISQRRMNAMVSNLNLDSSNVSLESRNISAASTKISTQVLNIVDTANKLKDEIEEVKPILVELKSTLSDLKTLKETIKFKDNLIIAYQNDLKALKIEIENIRQKGV